MNKFTLSTVAAVLLLPSLACAQTLQEQISAVDGVITDQKQSEIDAAARKQRQMDAQNAAAAVARAKEQGRATAQYAAQSAERQKAQQIKNAQAAAQQAVKDQAKQREQARLDKLRDLELEERSLDLEAKRARAKRANEFVDQELKAQAATTDVVQSEADATRNVSAGVGENLKSTGRAAETKASKWFSR